MPRQIIALGGGGFSSEPTNYLLDDYILSTSTKKKPNICFIGTASGDAITYIDKFYECYSEKKCNPTHLSLFKGKTENIEDFIMKQDIIYVGGGNTRNLLVLWKEWGLDTIIKRAYQKGIIMSGLSAGSICWFEEGLTDSIPKRFSRLECLGMLKGSNCPHFDSEKGRRSQYRKLIRDGSMKDGLATDDNVGLHFIDEELYQIVSSRIDASAYSYTRHDEKVMKKKLKPTYLG